MIISLLFFCFVFLQLNVSYRSFEHSGNAVVSENTLFAKPLAVKQTNLQISKGGGGQRELVQFTW